MQVPQWIIDSIANGARTAVVGGVTVGIGVICRWIYRKGIAIDAVLANHDEFRAKLDKIDGLQTDVTALNKVVAGISYEVKDNSGGSLKDAVKATGKSVNRIEERQVLHEAVLRARIESADDIAFYCRADGEFDNVTAGFTEMTGLDVPGCQNEHWKTAIHPDDVQRVTEMWHEALRTRTTFFADYRFRHVRTEGSTWCRVQTSPVIVDGKVVSWAGRIKPLAEIEYPPDADIEAAKVHIDPAMYPKPDPKTIG